MYSKLFDRDISYRKIEEFDDRLAKMGATIIYCHKDQEKHIDDEEDKAFINKAMYDKMTVYYREYCSLSKCNYAWINTSDEHLDSQLQYIMQNI